MRCGSSTARAACQSSASSGREPEFCLNRHRLPPSSLCSLGIEQFFRLFHSHASLHRAELNSPPPCSQARHLFAARYLRVRGIRRTLCSSKHARNLRVAYARTQLLSCFKQLILVDILLLQMRKHDLEERLTQRKLGCKLGVRTRISSMGSRSILEESTWKGEEGGGR